MVRHGAETIKAAPRTATDTDESKPGLFQRTVANAQSTWWEGLASIPARGQISYSFVASRSPTPAPRDSRASCTWWTRTRRSVVLLVVRRGHSGHSIGQPPPRAARRSYCVRSEHHVAALASQCRTTSPNYRGLSRPRRDRSEPSGYRRSSAPRATRRSPTRTRLRVLQLVAVDVHVNTSVAAIAAPPSALGVDGTLCRSRSRSVRSRPTRRHGGARSRSRCRAPHAVTAQCTDDAAGRARAGGCRTARGTPSSYTLEWGPRRSVRRTRRRRPGFRARQKPAASWTKRIAVIH